MTAPPQQPKPAFRVHKGLDDIQHPQRRLAHHSGPMHSRENVAKPKIRLHHDVSTPKAQSKIMTGRRLKFTALTILACLALLVWNRHTFGLSDWSPQFLPDHQLGDSFFVPRGLRVRECTEGGDWEVRSRDTFRFPPPDLRGKGGFAPTAFPYSSEISLDLPVTSDALFLLSRGPLLSGGVEIITRPNPSDTIKVHVNARYFRKELFAHTKICTVGRKGGGDGIGIFSPPKWKSRTAHDQLHYQITVVLPEPLHSGPLLIHNFETSLPNFFHQVGDLGKRVTFERLNLEGQNAPIRAESVTADAVDFRTSNGAVHGNFNIFTALNIRTSNALLKANIITSGDKVAVGNQIGLRTTNGALESNITLLASGEEDRLSVDAMTKNGPLDIVLKDAPLASTIRLIAETSNAPATVSAPPTFEGGFSLTSRNGEQLMQRRNVIDPSGEGRDRVVDNRRMSKAVIGGDVHWGTRKGPGTIQIKTSNAPATISL